MLLKSPTLVGTVGYAGNVAVVRYSTSLLNALTSVGITGYAGNVEVVK